MQTRNWIGLATVAGAAAIVGGTYMRYRNDLNARSLALEAKSEIANTAIGPIEYGREGSGPAVFVIHGAGGGYDQGLMLGHEMVGENTDIIAPSRFGYLRTPMPDNGSVAAQAKAHIALLDTLGINETIVMGVSAGAPSAVELALQYPDRVRALILVVPRAYDPNNLMGVSDTAQNKAVLRMMEGSANFAYWLSARIARKPLLRFFGVEPSLDANAPKEEREKITYIINDMLPISSRAAGFRNDSETELPQPHLEDINTPTLIITAEDDLFNSLPGARYAAEHIPDAKLKIFKTGGHLLISHGEDVRKAVAAFLSEQIDKVAQPPKEKVAVNLSEAMLEH
jgi:2-hydroxy-6-oxonona-2,4-dienedioate hydrolase